MGCRAEEMFCDEFHLVDLRVADNCKKVTRFCTPRGTQLRVWPLCQEGQRPQQRRSGGDREAAAGAPAAMALEALGEEALDSCGCILEHCGGIVAAGTAMPSSTAAVLASRQCHLHIRVAVPTHCFRTAWMPRRVSMLLPGV